jgi:hypothetical protein
MGGAGGRLRRQPGGRPAGGGRRDRAPRHHLGRPGRPGIGRLAAHRAPGGGPGAAPDRQAGAERDRPLVAGGRALRGAGGRALRRARAAPPRGADRRGPRTAAARRRPPRRGHPAGQRGHPAHRDPLPGSAAGWGSDPRAGRRGDRGPGADHPRSPGGDLRPARSDGDPGRGRDRERRAHRSAQHPAGAARRGRGAGEHLGGGAGLSTGSPRSWCAMSPSMRALTRWSSA